MGTAQTGKGSKEASTGRQVFDFLHQLVPFTQGLIISTLPRGSVHIVQPGRCPETLLKAYYRDLHKEDRLAWNAILRGQTLRPSDCWSQQDFATSPYLHNVLTPHGLRHAVGAPLTAPVLNGYPGAVVLFRTAEDGDFTEAELNKLKTVGKDVDDFINKHRSSRNTELAMNTDPWTHTAPSRVFIFNKDGKPVFPKKELGLDARVQEQLDAHAKAAVEHSKRGQTYTDRLLLPDSRGDLWVFRCEVYKDFPALGGGTFVFFMLQP
jgi:hypothetical protein